MNKKFKILIIDDLHPVLLELFGEHTVEYAPDCAISELPELLKDAEILILRSKLQLTAHWIDLAPSLQCIGRLGSGMDNIDVEYATQKGIACFNAPEGNRNAVAEQAVGMLLSLLHNIHKSANQVSAKVWDRNANQGTELSDLTVGIIGFGNVGSQLAQLLSGFSCKVLAYDRFKTGFGSEHAHECSLEKLQQEADIISLHVPLNSSSKEMINKEFINTMAKPFYLLNLSRGGVIKTGDVVDGLKDSKIIGCGLDVFVNEKLPTFTSEEQDWFDFLANNNRVIFTPHIGGLTNNSYYKLATILADKLLNWIKINTVINRN